MKTRLVLLVVLLVLAAAATVLSVVLVPRTETAQVPLPDPPEGYAVENNFSFRECFEVGERMDAEGNPVTSVTHTLAEYAGKPSAVIFWSSWSASSREQLKDVDAVYADYEGRAAVLPVNVGKAGKDSEKKARIAMADGGYGLPLYVDSTGVPAFNITSAPTALFFDGMGNLVKTVTGLCDEETLRSTLDGMLEEGSE